MLLIIAGLIMVAVWFYILFGREWLDAHLQGTPYAWWHEQVEDVLWDRSRTILASKLYWVGGTVLAVHELAIAAGVDWTPILNEIAAYVPERWRGLVLSGAVILTGIGFQWLRSVTTTALAEKS